MKFIAYVLSVTFVLSQEKITFQLFMCLFDEKKSRMTLNRQIFVFFCTAKIRLKMHGSKKPIEPLQNSQIVSKS